VLQIATGKLFTLDIARTNRLRGILYSNARFGFRERTVETLSTALNNSSSCRGQALFNLTLQALPWVHVRYSRR
jgi:hypothetical protein